MTMQKTRWSIRSGRRGLSAAFFPVLMAGVIGVGTAQAAPAGSATESVQAMQTRVSVPAGYRAQLNAFYGELIQVAKENPRFNRGQELLNLGKQGTEAVRQMNSSQLAILYQDTRGIPRWQQAPQELATLNHLRFKAPTGFRTQEIDGGPTCVENGTTFPEPGLSAVIAAQDAAQVADIAVEITPDTAVAAPNPLRLAAVAISKPLDLAATALQNTHDLYEECVSDQQGTLIQSISDNLATDTSNILTAVSDLKTDLDTGITNIRADIAGLKGDIDTRLTAVANQITGVQTTIDQHVETRQIHIQVVTPPGGKNILVSTTEGGQPITATLVSIKVAAPPTSLTFTNMTSQVATSAPIAGVLNISFPNTNAVNTVYQIEVKETSTIDGQAVTQYGTILADQHSW